MGNQKRLLSPNLLGQEPLYTPAVPPGLAINRPLSYLHTPKRRVCSGLPTLFLKSKVRYPLPKRKIFGLPSKGHSQISSTLSYTNRKLSAHEKYLLLTLSQRFLICYHNYIYLSRFLKVFCEQSNRAVLAALCSFGIFYSCILSVTYIFTKLNGIFNLQNISFRVLMLLQSTSSSLWL